MRCIGVVALAVAAVVALIGSAQAGGHCVVQNSKAVIVKNVKHVAVANHAHVQKVVVQKVVQPVVVQKFVDPFAFTNFANPYAQPFADVVFINGQFVRLVDVNQFQLRVNFFPVANFAY